MSAPSLLWERMLEEQRRRNAEEGDDAGDERDEVAAAGGQEGGEQQEEDEAAAFLQFDVERLPQCGDLEADDESPSERDSEGPSRSSNSEEEAVPARCTACGWEVYNPVDMQQCSVARPVRCQQLFCYQRRWTLRHYDAEQCRPVWPEVNICQRRHDMLGEGHILQMSPRHAWISTFSEPDRPREEVEFQPHSYDAESGGGAVQQATTVQQVRRLNELADPAARASAAAAEARSPQEPSSKAEEDDDEVGLLQRTKTCLSDESAATGEQEGGEQVSSNGQEGGELACAAAGGQAGGEQVSSNGQEGGEQVSDAAVGQEGGEQVSSACRQVLSISIV
jgi:hypothetical protein